MDSTTIPPPSERTAARIERYRAIFISGLHLGTSACHAALVLEFLRRTESDYLYLVGDVVDAGQLQRRRYWPQTHSDVVQLLLGKARTGTRVIYVPARRDEVARRFESQAFRGIRIESETMHVTEPGRRLLVTHGDLFGGHWWLARLFGIRESSEERALERFRKAAAAAAKRIGAVGVVCGHTRQPEIRDVDGIVCCSVGDLVESLAALVETEDGGLHLVDWRGARLPHVARVADGLRRLPGQAIAEGVQR